MLRAFEVTREHAQAKDTEVAVFRVHGHLDAHTAPRFEEALRHAVANGCRAIAVDCTGLDYISSAGLGVLIETHRALRAKRGDLKLADLPPAIGDIFDILGFSKVIPSYPTLAEALEAFAEAPGEAPS